MENSSRLKVLLVAEGSGGHLIPAIQVARILTHTGARIKLWYARRQQTEPLIQQLTHEMPAGAVETDPIVVTRSANPLARLWQCGQLWHRAEQCFDTFQPDVVVGFGGWLSAPVVLAAHHRRIGCLLHEQNVVMGRANRLLAPWVDRIALSFHETHPPVGSDRSVITGLPVRTEIGQGSRTHAAAQFGFDPAQSTLLVLGGSQGARAINRIVTQLIRQLTPVEQQVWQILHVTGATDEAAVKRAYADAKIRAWVASFCDDMAAAYAVADVVIARAGASTIAELARCGTSAILIPYPYAGGHQVANARLVEEIGGGLMLEEREAAPERVLGFIRHLLTDPRLRRVMGMQMRALSAADAADRLADLIVELARERVIHNGTIGV